ncbi:hypothetical protein BOX15_Mlig004783g3 [Macrostomum lignano]|uniref:Uncharacterized protein n=2 Tax=Macrostomum lignano TaxID=282301 RepID=A0A267FNG1_9PLAT|nr:hypothetical protein BOX15_Mlig004783g1 [Macrostomum lignano]PAA74657.1 hypothetical protein BOX15_Mlig004783g3 [Macrostomum lignano]
MSVANLNVTQQRCNNNDLTVTVRAGMRNSVTGLSFIQSPQLPNVDQQRLTQKQLKETRRQERLENQGTCCWRIETNQGLRYRIVADLLCALTLLPGAVAVILLSFAYIYSEPSPSEPYPWLKYALAASGCLLLLLYIAWLATGCCLYRRAVALKRPNDGGTLCKHSRRLGANQSRNDVQEIPMANQGAAQAAAGDSALTNQNNANPLILVRSPTPTPVEQQAKHTQRLLSDEV